MKKSKFLQIISALTLVAVFAFFSPFQTAHAAVSFVRSDINQASAASVTITTAGAYAAGTSIIVSVGYHTAGDSDALRLYCFRFRKWFIYTRHIFYTHK